LGINPAVGDLLLKKKINKDRPFSQQGVNILLLKSLDNALNLISYFTREKRAWGVRELAKEIGISHTIVYRILNTYENHGILIKNPDTNKYQLGLRLLKYGQIIRDAFSISDIIGPIMKKMAAETKETIF
jgi:DNA-binding IclR family transcriptional regulator